MTRSIRKFLLINLLLGIALMTALTTLGNLVLNDQEVQQQLDSELLQDNLAFQAITSMSGEENYLEYMNKNIQELPRLIRQLRYFKNQDKPGRSPYLANHVEFQIWSPDNKLLVSSPNAPITDISLGQEGFSNFDIDGETWRVFMTVHPKNGHKVVFAERYTLRDVLTHRLMRNDFLILLITYPFFGLLIWIIVGRGLSSIKRVTEEVAYRESHYLEPVNIAEVPEEISPLVDELNQLFSRLQQGIEREKRFSADAAHELRTPLAALRTQVQVALKSTDDKQKLIHSLNNVIKAVDRSSHVVQQLLTLSRLNPEAGDALQQEPVNLVAIASETVADLAPVACDKDIDIELIAPNDKIIILGNATILHILLRNLVDNAIRYTPEKSHIAVKVRCSDQQATLQVIDNGPGIAAKLRERVFERFYRILGNKSPGSGLGLAIVAQIVNLHHGDITLDATNDDDSGLTVTIHFPVYDPSVIPQ